jgi:hypothetical protein
MCEDEAEILKDAERLSMLKVARRNSGLPLDFWADLTEGLPQSCCAILCGRSSFFPKYMNSKVKP